VITHVNALDNGEVLIVQRVSFFYKLKRFDLNEEHSAVSKCIML
jgi:hypothetical protein